MEKMMICANPSCPAGRVFCQKKGWKHQKYCSPRCRREHWGQKNKKEMNMADDNFKTQRQRIFLLLGSRIGEWVPLTAILDLRIGQYNARIKELREAGHNIECKVENVGRSRHSSYRLVPKHAQENLFAQGASA